MLSCSVWFSAPSLWMGGGLDSRCVGRVYGADGAARYRPGVAQRVGRGIALLFHDSGTRRR